MNIYEKLSEIQKEMVVPKNLHNDFGNFDYRSYEGILEVAKPICHTHKTVLFVGDGIINYGDRYYIEATATLQDLESNERIEIKAFAREISEKAKMDSSQLTGVASSYARKYALNGLFCLDDNKDPDSNEYQRQKKQAEEEARKQAEIEEAKKEAAERSAMISEYAKKVRQLLGDGGVDFQGYFQKKYGKNIYEVTISSLNVAIKKIDAELAKADPT